MTVLDRELACEPEPPDAVRPHRFTLDEYLRLSELGFFNDQRVEFVDGEILDMPAQKDSRAYSLTHAVYWCVGAFPDGRFWVGIRASMLLMCLLAGLSIRAGQWLRAARRRGPAEHGTPARLP